MSESKSNKGEIAAIEQQKALNKKEKEKVKREMSSGEIVALGFSIMTIVAGVIGAIMLAAALANPVGAAVLGAVAVVGAIGVVATNLHKIYRVKQLQKNLLDQVLSESEENNDKHLEEYRNYMENTKVNSKKPDSEFTEDLTEEQLIEKFQSIEWEPSTVRKEKGKVVNELEESNELKPTNNNVDEPNVKKEINKIKGKSNSNINPTYKKIITPKILKKPKVTDLSNKESKFVQPKAISFKYKRKELKPKTLTAEELTAPEKVVNKIPMMTKTTSAKMDIDPVEAMEAEMNFGIQDLEIEEKEEVSTLYKATLEEFKKQLTDEQKKYLEKEYGENYGDDQLFEKLVEDNNELKNLTELSHNDIEKDKIEKSIKHLLSYISEIMKEEKQQEENIEIFDFGGDVEDILKQPTPIVPSLQNQQKSEQTTQQKSKLIDNEIKDISTKKSKNK